MTRSGSVPCLFPVPYDFRSSAYSKDFAVETCALELPGPKRPRYLSLAPYRLPFWPTREVSIGLEFGMVILHSLCAIVLTPSQETQHPQVSCKASVQPRRPRGHHHHHHHHHFSLFCSPLPSSPTSGSLPACMIQVFGYHQF